MNQADQGRLRVGVWGVRCQVADAGRSVDSYAKRMGFQLDRPNLPAFAQASETRLERSGASGPRPKPGGTRLEPRGGNRVVISVGDLSELTEAMMEKGRDFRNHREAGPAASQCNRETSMATGSSCSNLRLARSRLRSREIPEAFSLRTAPSLILATGARAFPHSGKG